MKSSVEVIREEHVWIGDLLGCLDRVVEEAERTGQLDNTLIFVTADNGSSGEGGLTGSFNETYVLNGLQTPFESNMQHYDEWGGPNTYPHFHAGWALAGNTPFQYFKQIVHRGGQSDALIAHWPDKIKDKGAIRTQYHHIADIAPTILEAAGLPEPPTFSSFLASVSDLCGHALCGSRLPRVSKHLTLTRGSRLFWSLTLALTPSAPPE